MELDAHIGREELRQQALEDQAARSRILVAAYDHLRQLGAKDLASIDWGLDFDLHFGLAVEVEEPVE
jgi:hypothetical protein